MIKYEKISNSLFIVDIWNKCDQSYVFNWLRVE